MKQNEHLHSQTILRRGFAPRLEDRNNWELGKGAGDKDRRDGLAVLSVHGKGIRTGMRGCCAQCIRGRDKDRKEGMLCSVYMGNGG